MLNCFLCSNDYIRVVRHANRENEIYSIMASSNTNMVSKDFVPDK